MIPATANRRIEGESRHGHSAEDLKLADQLFERASAVGILAEGAPEGAKPDTRAVTSHHDQRTVEFRRN
jgi:hypothetical protein